jgi:hypothetical protein
MRMKINKRYHGGKNNKIARQDYPALQKLVFDSIKTKTIIAAYIK